MDVIDVVPHLRDRHTVMSLLKRTPAPLRAHCSRPLRPGAGYQFTAEDISEFIAERRSDLAELVLESTDDIDVLYAVSRMSVPVPVLKAICRNEQTPGDLLAYLSCDERKGVSAAARSALAGKLSVMVRDAGPVVETFRELVYCPDEDLERLFSAVSKSWHYKALDYVIVCVLERPSPVTDEVWQLIVGRDWNWMGSYSSNKALDAIARHPRTTVEELVAIRAQARFRGPRNVVTEALLDRVEPGSDRWFALLSELDWGSTSKNGERHAKHLTREKALQVLDKCEHDVWAAVESGKLTDADADNWARKWAREQTTVQAAALKLLAHPGLQEETLLKCTMRSDGNTTARAFLVKNPNLTAVMQQRLAHDARTRPTLAGNPALTVESAQAVVRYALNVLSDTDTPEYIPWRAQGTLLAILANENLPCQVRMDIPAEALIQPRYEASKPLAAIVTLLDEKFNQDPDHWKSFLGLLGEWEGTLNDLVTVVTVL